MCDSELILFMMESIYLTSFSPFFVVAQCCEVRIHSVLDHLLQIKPISRFLHIPDIVPTISKVALSSFKDKISTIPHFLAHIVTQSQIKYSTAPCSSSARRLSHTFLLFNMSTFIFIINFSLCNIY